MLVTTVITELLLLMTLGRHLTLLLQFIVVFTSYCRISINDYIKKKIGSLLNKYLKYIIKVIC